MRQVNSLDAPAQFITTTFRPELVEVANNCYGIALINKVSNIYPLDKVIRSSVPSLTSCPLQTLSCILLIYYLFLFPQRDAQDFVTNLMNEEEAVGQVTSVPAFSRVNRQQEEAADGGLSSPTSASAARRRPRDPVDDGEEDEAADEDDRDDGGLSELQDVDEIGEISLSGIGRRRDRGTSASTSVGVGSGRVHRGNLQDSDEDDDNEEEDADLFDASEGPKRGSSMSTKSKG